jgi:hypothetical protein
MWTMDWEPQPVHTGIISKQPEVTLDPGLQHAFEIWAVMCDENGMMVLGFI